MLITPIYNGQGLGNQLSCYVTTRCIALDNGYDFGIAFPERFKGRSFLDLDFGKLVFGLSVPVEGMPPSELPENITSYYEEQGERHPDGTDVRGYDVRLMNISDNTCIHGLMQGVRYYEKHRAEVDKWLRVKPIEMADNVCVINFRGGEYKYVQDFFLPKEYWDNAIAMMRDIRLDMKFEVHTDDAECARTFFPDFPIISDIGINWRSIRYAKYLILSNSSFAILPAWLGESKDVIAPWGWGRYNKEYWSLEQNKVDGWHYQKKDGTYEVYTHQL